jgi:hypothetical protein
MKNNFPISLYWKCQVIGWSIASFYWGYAAFAGSRTFNFKQAVADFAFDVLIGIGLTHCYRYFALQKNWHQLKLTKLVSRIAAAIFILSTLYMVLIIGKLYIVRVWFNEHFTISYKSFFNGNWLTVFITGTRLMSVWVLAWHLYHYAQREIFIAKENARLSVIAKEAQLNNLSAQLNPHFFFNSLSNIKFLVMENPVQARRAIDLLSDLLRNSLYGKSDKLIPLKEELNLVKDYLELEKLRFEERLQISIEVDNELTEINIPPLCIQTLVENAIKHGIEKRTAGGLIKVQAVKQTGYLQLTVQNPGKLQVPVQTGLGLKNLKERLQLQYNGSATFSIEELTGEKIQATILISME